MSSIVRIFISGDVVRRVESGDARERGKGRPLEHAGCLLMAMFAVKCRFGIGYRETARLFAERGYANLPDFRTLHWRLQRLGNFASWVRILYHDSQAEQGILIAPRRRAKARCSAERVGPKEWRSLVKSLGANFMETAL